jgi:NADH-quinone oxidoreductase subunit M
MISDYGGVVNTMPEVRRADDALRHGELGPAATSGFVGEFMVIMGAMKANFWLAFVAAPRWCSAPPIRCGCTSGSCSAP